MCSRFTNFLCDDWENIYTLSYYHHQIVSINYNPLFRVRSWNNGMSCMSFYILMETHTPGQQHPDLCGGVLSTQTASGSGILCPPKWHWHPHLPAWSLMCASFNTETATWTPATGRCLGTGLKDSSIGGISYISPRSLFILFDCVIFSGMPLHSRHCHYRT